MGAYIGITGIRTVKEVRDIRNLVKSKINYTKRLSIAYGIVHHLHEHPVQEEIQSLRLLSLAIEKLRIGSLTILHLNGWNNSTSTINQIKRLDATLPATVIFQINKFDWNTYSLCKLQASMPTRQLILPFNAERTRKEECYKVIRKNSARIHTLLIDSSEGNGKDLDMNFALPMILDFRSALPYIPLAIAGGLGARISAKTLRTISKLRPISLDAESGLSVNGFLDSKRVADYLAKTISAYSP
jgi:hypothetical protein